MITAARPSDPFSRQGRHSLRPGSSKPLADSAAPGRPASSRRCNTLLHDRGVPPGTIRVIGPCPGRAIANDGLGSAETRASTLTRRAPRHDRRLASSLSRTTVPGNRASDARLAPCHKDAFPVDCQSALLTIASQVPNKWARAGRLGWKNEGSRSDPGCRRTPCRSGPRLDRRRGLVVRAPVLGRNAVGLHVRGVRAAAEP